MTNTIEGWQSLPPLFPNSGILRHMPLLPPDLFNLTGVCTCFFFSIWNSLTCYSTRSSCWIREIAEKASDSWEQISSNTGCGPKANKRGCSFRLHSNALPGSLRSVPSHNDSTLTHFSLSLCIVLLTDCHVCLHSQKYASIWSVMCSFLAPTVSSTPRSGPGAC